MAHLGMVSPSVAVLAQSGSTGQKAAEAVADGHAENSKDKR